MGTDKMLNVNAGLLLLLLMPVVLGDFVFTEIYFTSEANTINISFSLSSLRIPANQTTFFNTTITHNSTSPIISILNKSGSGEQYLKFYSSGDYENLTVALQQSGNSSHQIRAYAASEGVFSPSVSAYSINDSKYDSKQLSLIVNETNPVENVTIATLSSISIGDSINPSIRILNPYTGFANVTIFYCIQLAGNATDCNQTTYDSYDTRVIGTWENYTKALSTSGKGVGSYSLKISARYKDTETIPSGAKASRDFSISSATTTTSSGGAGSSGSVVAVPASPKASLKISASAEEKICGGITETKSVRVSGTGKHSSASLSVSGIPSGWISIEPSSFQSLEDSTAVFILTYNAEEKLGNYPVTYSASSDKGSSEFRGIVSIVKCEIPLKKEDRMLLEIQSLRATIQNVLNDAVAERGLGAKDVIEPLTRALDDLDEAESALQSKDVHKAEVLLKGSRAGLQEAVARIPVGVAVASPYSFYAIPVFLTALGAAVLYRFRRRLKIREGDIKAAESSSYEYKRRLLRKLGDKLAGRPTDVERKLGINEMELKPVMWRSVVRISELLKDPESFHGKAVMISNAKLVLLERSDEGYVYSIADDTGQIEGLSKEERRGPADITGTLKIKDGKVYVEF